MSEETRGPTCAAGLVHDEREYSFVDATSFVGMNALRIGAALAFDGDFSAAGFTELRP